MNYISRSQQELINTSCYILTEVCKYLYVLWYYLQLILVLLNFDFYCNLAVLVYSTDETEMKHSQNFVLAKDWRTGQKWASSENEVWKIAEMPWPPLQWDTP